MSYLKIQAEIGLEISREEADGNIVDESQGDTAEVLRYCSIRRSCY
jgi:hypothetical protein